MSEEEDFGLTGTDVVAERYRLEKRIASGSMGEVWRAEDMRLHRTVAVKLLHTGLSDNQQFRQRFAEEARLVAGLNSPHVTTVHDYGEDHTDAGVRSYLVMELVHGRPLDEILAERGTLTVAETIRVVREAAEGLQAAHEAGIVHRDVKPANMLITDDGAVKLIDFGIARARGTAGLTETGRIMGTLAYVCPDQIANDDPAPSMDIYSLGVVAYECLAGRPPFVSETPASVLNAHLTEPPPALGDDVPEPVSRAVLNALRKKAEHRWSTVEQFAHEIAKPHLDVPLVDALPVGDPATDTGHDVAATPLPTAAIPTGKRPRRDPRVLVAAVVTIALLAVVLWSLPWQPGRDSQTDHDANQSPGQAAESSPSRESTSDDPTESTSDDEAAADNPTADDAPTDTDSPTDSDDGGSMAVPDLNGKGAKAVPAILEKHGFHHSQPVETGPHDGYKKCVVYQQSPKPGSHVTPDTTITYYYATEKAACDKTTARVTNTAGFLAAPATAVAFWLASRRSPPIRDQSLGSFGGRRNPATVCDVEAERGLSALALWLPVRGRHGHSFPGVRSCQPEPRSDHSCPFCSPYRRWRWC
ncbi:serine/threonine protein kinase [Stackebrandtia nassauensis]|uniref:non-specific serine/threonine protein kinase n=1 Tax=Stackebrandtia nassauensis (strain DSM 44728 / CIP 108903 / NRRL B-16338 / NBRC 102104 / LLR-40K-21) TaxID=446470 RepID=D3PWK1_STANL|nr:serine/threonine protein kinase [Stackebrandtia nassauensis]ADD43223.1 serine/threonine protein kinase [Stackebrandtia nassauensis DSM 44728]